MFEHDAPYIAADLLSEYAIKEHIHLHFVGPQGKMDRLIRDTLQTDSLLARHSLASAAFRL